MRGAAWSVPAIVVAGAAPAVASSASCVPTTSYDQFNSGTLQGGFYPANGCCLEPGQTVTVSLTNAGTASVDMRTNNSSSLWSSNPTSVTIAPGKTGSLTYTYVGGRQCTGTVKYNTYLTAHAAGSVFTSVTPGGNTWSHTF